MFKTAQVEEIRQLYSMLAMDSRVITALPKFRITLLDNSLILKLMLSCKS